MFKISRSVALVGLTAGFLVATTVASGSIHHDDVVLQDPVNYTPQVLVTTDVPKPHIDGISQLGGVIYAGGRFDRVEEDGGAQFNRGNFMAFNANNGQILDLPTDPTFDRQIFAVEAFGDSIYVGGQFRQVNGIVRRAVVKLNLDGTVDMGFNARLGGQVNKLQMHNGRLIVGGSVGNKLIALNPDTGADTGYINLGIADQIPNSWGTVSVYSFTISPAGDKIIATGNFRVVSGQSRHRLFVANLGETGATLDPWYYADFRRACSSTHPRRIAYLQGVDFSPDGSYFVVVATGQIPNPGDLGRTVCDGIGRFDMDDMTQPQWINYTGGDSVWAVSVTGAAVYVQGHFQWLDNRFGFASRCPANRVCARRLAIGAIDPDSGLALPWAPNKPASIGGKVFLATDEGLWVGSDSQYFDGEPHRGIAFAPLP